MQEGGNASATVIRTQRARTVGVQQHRHSLNTPGLSAGKSMDALPVNVGTNRGHLLLTAPTPATAAAATHANRRAAFATCMSTTKFQFAARTLD
jgi:hypothetical protein